MSITSNRLPQPAYGHLPKLPIDEVEVWADKFLTFVGKKKSPATYVAYGTTMRKFAPWCEDWDGVLGTPCVDEFCERPRPPRAPDGASASAYNRDLAAIRLFFWWLNSYEEMGVHNPCGPLKAKKIDLGIPKTIPLHIWLRVWLSDLTDDERLWLGLGYYAGLRRSELDTVLVSHFNVETRQIVDFTRKGDVKKVVEYGALADVVIKKLPEVAQHVPKWLGLVERYATTREPNLPINPRASQGFNEAGELMFDINHSWVNDDLRKILARAGVDRSAFSSHDLRRSFASNMTGLIPDILIQRSLGHSSPVTTQRYQRTDGAVQRFADQL